MTSFSEMSTINSTVRDVYRNSTQEPPLNVTKQCLNEPCLSSEDYLAYIEDYLYPDAVDWTIVALYVAVFTVGIVGNFLVCYAVWGNPHMRTVTNFFIVNLASADFLVILFCLPSTALVDITQTWFIGSVMCKLFVYVQVSDVNILTNCNSMCTPNAADFRGANATWLVR